MPCLPVFPAALVPTLIPTTGSLDLNIIRVTLLQASDNADIQHDGPLPRRTGPGSGGVCNCSASLPSYFRGECRQLGTSNEVPTVACSLPFRPPRCWRIGWTWLLSPTPRCLLPSRRGRAAPPRCWLLLLLPQAARLEDLVAHVARATRAITGPRVRQQRTAQQHTTKTQDGDQSGLHLLTDC